MKHVREDLPDIQRMRPEVSATTAAVLDRMTEKDLAHRYADIPMLVADLEDALAIEAARSGTSTGEATAVIRTLPAHARRRLPFRMRHPMVAARRGRPGRRGRRRRRPDHRRRRPRRMVERGTGAGKAPATPEGTAWSPSSAPRRTGTTRSATKRSTLTGLAHVDRDEGTAWTHRAVPAGLEGANKAGVGLYIDAKPRVEAVEMQIETPEPGWRATIYAAPPGEVPSRSTRAGRRSAAARSTARASASSSTRRRAVPLLPGLDHEARRGRRARRDLRDPAAPKVAA